MQIVHFCLSPGPLPRSWTCRMILVQQTTQNTSGSIAPTPFASAKRAYESLLKRGGLAPRLFCLHAPLKRYRRTLGWQKQSPVIHHHRTQGMGSRWILVWSPSLNRPRFERSPILNDCARFENPLLYISRESRSRKGEGWIVGRGRSIMRVERKVTQSSSGSD